MKLTFKDGEPVLVDGPPGAKIKSLRIEFEEHPSLGLRSGVASGTMVLPDGTVQPFNGIPLVFD